MYIATRVLWQVVEPTPQQGGSCWVRDSPLHSGGRKRKARGLRSQNRTKQRNDCSLNYPRTTRRRTELLRTCVAQSRLQNTHTTFLSTHNHTQQWAINARTRLNRVVPCSHNALHYIRPPSYFLSKLKRRRSTYRGCATCPRPFTPTACISVMKLQPNNQQPLLMFPPSVLPKTFHHKKIWRRSPKNVKTKQRACEARDRSRTRTAGDETDCWVKKNTRTTLFCFQSRKSGIVRSSKRAASTF